MAKNVIITEDGQTKTISNTTRIRTALEGGGTCDWIPKDDVPLQELTVTEDGVYDPEEGYYGFSQVTANGIGAVVEGTLVEKTVTKNGTYNITDESGNPYGYSKITVSVDTSDEDSGGGSGGGGSNPVVGKDEDGNDTMAEADDDGNIVMTALPTEIKVIIPPTKLEYNRYEEIDYSGISVYAYISKAVHWLGTTTTAVSEGSSNNTVSIGGSSVTASVGDGVLYAPDRTGVNDIQLVWDGTKWVKPGNYSAEKAIWKTDKYPTGKIPFEELIYPIKRANDITNNITNNVATYEYDEKKINVFKVSQIGYGTSYDYNGRNLSTNRLINFNDTRDAVKTGKNTVLVFGDKYYTLSSTYRVNLVTRIDGGIIYTDDPPTVISVNETYTYHSISDYFDITVGGLAFYVSYYPPTNALYTVIGERYVDNVVYYNDFEDYPITRYSYSEIYDVYKYGKRTNDTTYSLVLPVQWKRPGDGKILETTFTAWMKDDGGDNNGGDD